MSCSNPYQPIKATVESVISETPNIKTFVLRAEDGFAFKTGQFVEITLPGVGEAPFTPSSSPQVKELTEITIMNAGYVTDLMHKKIKSGMEVGIRGPYGLGYPLEKYYGKDILILGGGVGMAPLRSFLLALLAQKDKFKRIILAYGAKTSKDLVYRKAFSKWESQGIEVHLSIDKKEAGWNGNVGVVTTLLDKVDIDLANTVAVVCGPPIMMKFGTLALLKKGFKDEDVYLSMEKNMSCGLGKCGHCMLGEYYVCKDGPVFTYAQIKEIPGIWD